MERQKPPPISGLSTDNVLRQAIAAQSTWTERDAKVLVASAIRANPEDARLHQMMGALERALDETEKALGHFEQAAALAPENSHIAYAVAQTRLDGGREAVEDFQRALSLEPGNQQSRLGLVSALLACGSSAEADKYLDHWLIANPAWAEGHAAQIRLRWQAGEGKSSWRTLTPAAMNRPKDLALWRELILGLMHAKQFETALSVIARGRAAYGQDLLFDSSEAGCLDELGDLAAAEARFMSIGRAADAGLALRFTRHLLRANRPQDAAAVAQAWVDQPGATHFWPYIATAWRISGDPRWNWLEGDERLVGEYDISDQIGPIGELAAHLRSLHTSVHQPLEQSLRGGTQTNGRLFSRIDPILRKLRDGIASAVARHAAQLPPFDPAHPTLRTRPQEIRFSGSWSVRLTGQGYHAAHMHPMGWYSSALYIALPGDMNRNDPHAGWLSLGDQPEFSECPPAFRLIKPKPGTLALFPSTMWHGTRPIGGGERMTVAFDVAVPPDA